MRQERSVAKVTGFDKFCRSWGVFFSIIASIFIIVLATSHILAGKYVIGIAFAVVFLTSIIDVLMIPLKKGKGGKIFGLIFSVLLTLVMVVGVMYIGHTLNFFSEITDTGMRTEEYSVIVREDSPYEKIGDIKGVTVKSLEGGEGYDKACDRLKDLVDVKIQKETDPAMIASDLLEGRSEAVFMNGANYEIICSCIDEFEENTRILKTIEVKVKDNSLHKEGKKDVTKDSFNVMITGLDTKGNIDITSRSDVNMIMTVNPVKKTILLTSIPRDYYVDLPFANGAKDKLTHTGIYGSSMTAETIEENFGIDIDYYIKVNFSTVINLVNAMDGIDVNSDYTFNAGGYSYTKGINHMNGEEALTFARERYSFGDGDFQRTRDQQAVLEGIIGKLTGSMTILTRYTEILNSVEDNIAMDLSGSDIKALVRMQTADMTPWKIEHQMIGGNISSQYMPCYSAGGMKLSVVLPDDEEINQAVLQIKTLEEAK